MFGYENFKFHLMLNFINFLEYEKLQKVILQNFHLNALKQNSLTTSNYIHIHTQLQFSNVIFNLRKKIHLFSEFHNSYV